MEPDDQLQKGKYEETLGYVQQVDESLTVKKQLRPFGLCAGEFTVPDDFNDPLPEDILSAFEGR